MKSPADIAKDLAKEAFEAAMPPPGPKFAARLDDLHICPMVDGIKPHVGGPIKMGCVTVMIGGKPAARKGDIAMCAGPPDVIQQGSPTVKIGFMDAARFLDPTVHGGVIVTFCPTVIIGDSGKGGAMSDAKKSGAPLVPKNC